MLGQIVKKIITKLRLFYRVHREREILRIALFRAIPKKLIKKLVGTFAEFADQEIIFSQGDPPKYVYFIISGEVEIHLTDATKISEVIVKIGASQFFGELGVLNWTARAGTAIARGSVQALVMNGDIFYDLYWSIPNLRELMKTMQRVYKIPHRGIVSIAKEINEITTTYRFDGKIIVAKQQVDKNIFSMQQVGDVPISHTVRFTKHANLTREIVLSDKKLIGLTCAGEWDQLGYACNLLLDSVDIQPWQTNLFQVTGDLNSNAPARYVNDSEILCYCMNMNYGLVKKAIQNGMTDLEKLSSGIGAGGVCGSCCYRINELLGKTAWSMMYIDRITALTSKIRSYQLKLYQGKLFSYSAGQYIVIQIFIDNQWIERSYTLISIPENCEYYEIVVKQERQGAFSNWLFNHDGNNPLIRVSQPQGKFTLDIASNRPIVYFAGGIGIAPAIAFIRTLINLKQSKKIHIDYSAYTREELVFSDELQSFIKINESCTLYLRETNKDGIITLADIKQIITKFPNAHYYVCGHFEYEAAIVSALTSQGIARDNISVEIFLRA